MASATETLLRAAATGDVETVKHALATDARVDSVDWCGRTALMTAADRGHVHVVETLVVAGAELHRRCDHYTALEWAVRSGHSDIVQLLITAGAETSDGAMDNDSALLLAIKRRRFELCDVLLTATRDVDVTNRYGESPLIRACHANNLEMVRKLLKAGANVNHSSRLESPLTVAVKSGFNDIVVALLRDETVVALILATGKGHVDVIQQLLVHGVDANQCDHSGWSALLGSTLDHAMALAAERGYVDMIRLLLVYGADLEYTGQYEVTPLMVASRRGDRKAVVTLLEAGADVHAMDPHGFSALLEEVSFDRWRATRILLAWGADPNGGIHGAPTALEMAKAWPNGRKTMDLLQSLPTIDLEQS